MTTSHPSHGEDDRARLIAWSGELRRVHDRLREALALTRSTADPGDLLLFCHGFCTALTAHHRGEDVHLFPALAAAHPELGETLRRLQQDHSMIAHLVGALLADARRGADPEGLDRHLEGIAAIMESHFRYEERRLLAVLDSLALDADPETVLGPL